MNRTIHNEQPKGWNGLHLLKCTHSLNSRSRIDYLMYCDVLKIMSDGRLKVFVLCKWLAGVPCREMGCEKNMKKILILTTSLFAFYQTSAIAAAPYPQYEALVEKHAALQRLDKNIVWAVMGRESSGNRFAISNKNARGLKRGAAWGDIDAMPRPASSTTQIGRASCRERV